MQLMTSQQNTARHVSNERTGQQRQRHHPTAIVTQLLQLLELHSMQRCCAVHLSLVQAAVV